MIKQIISGTEIAARRLSFKAILSFLGFDVSSVERGDAEGREGIMTKKVFILINTLLCLCFGSYAQSSSNAGNFSTYAVDGNKITIHSDNNVDLQIEQISSDILKIWYDTDGFKRNNESFAVIKNGDSSQAINISEQPQSIEIYTGSLIVRIAKFPLQIQIFDKWQKLLMSDYKDMSFVFDSTKIASYKILKPGEKVYGLGEKNGSINRVGNSFKMWNSDKPCYQVNEDPLYKSIPFFMSSEGYGIYFDNTYKSEFDFGKSSTESYSFSTPGGEMIYYFIFGPSLKQIIANYIDLTGKPIMPPQWALGFAQCRGLLTNETLTREIAEGYREHQIPCDIIYQDIGWTNYLQNFEWREGNYTNPIKMLSDLEADGFKVIVSQDPVISQENKTQWKEADSLGYFTKDVRTGKSYDMPWPWGGNCGVVDFTKPEVADWWGNYQQKTIDAGVRGFWTDMGEPAWSNEESTDRLFMQHYLGMHDEIHNVYGFTWDKVVSEQFEKHNPNTRIFQMTRAAFAGLQRYTFGWSGDSGNGNDITTGWEQLAAQIPLAVSAGMSGVPFWSCDISGYCGDITDYNAMSELYVRWLQFGAFHPLSRIHHEGNNAVEPWLFGTEAEQLCRAAIENKYRLFPYIYTLSRETYDTGLPLMRAMPLEFPTDKQCANINSQFMFGDALLVAPVVEESNSVKKVYLPKGKWIDYNAPQTIFDGGKWIDYPVDLSTVPMFVKQGSIIPTMPVMQYINEHSDYPLILEVFPAKTNKKAIATIYEDDGESNNYKQNIYIKRNVECTSKSDEYEIIYSDEVSKNYDAVSRNIIYHIHLDKKTTSVLIENQKVKKSKNSADVWNIEKAKWYWDSATGILEVAVPTELVNKKIVIQ